MNTTLADEQVIALITQRWALARDSGDWEALATTVHPDATMTATWFHGPFVAFIEACKASFARGGRSTHMLGGTMAKVRGDRAIAQTRMAIQVRGAVDGVAVDVVSSGRFYDRFERRSGEWRIAERRCIYEKDRLDPVDPNARVTLDAALLAKYPEGYRHLAYLQTKGGQSVTPDLPGARGEALDRLLDAGERWLHGA